MSDEKQPDAIVEWEPRTASEGVALAKWFEKSSLMPREIKSAADIFVTICAGRDFGWSPMQSLRGIYVVKGKPSLAADSMVALAKSRPDVCEWFRMVESTPEIATYETKRKGDPGPVRMSFTIAEARAAGLGGDTWAKYPARMLRNRCKSALCKEVYEELFFGTFEEDEGREVERIVSEPRRKAALSTVTTEPARAAPAVVAEAVAKVMAATEPSAEPAREPGADDGEPPHDPATGEVRPTEAERLGERFRLASTLPETDAIGADVAAGVKSGAITQEERNGPLAVAYKAARERIRAVKP